MAGPIRIAVLANARQAKAELNSVANTTQGLGSRFRRAGALIGASIGGAAVVGALGKTIGLAKDFDLTMRQVGVQTGQTGQQLKGLSDLAMKMGADTVFSAQDASNAMLELAKGGLTAADIRAGALKTTMTLAAAGELEMGRAAEYVTQGMNTFGLAASQADRVATALAGGANASTASVESLGMALSQVGPGAKNAGLSLEETVAALSAFDNAGIKGSDAGTSLKTMLTRLVPATKGASTAMESVGLWTEKSGSAFVNANGTFKSMAQISGLLQRKLSGLSDAHRQQALQAIFGSDATRAATVLMNEGAKGITKYVKATKDQTTVQKMANTAMEGFSGAWEGLTGSIETVGIKLGTALLPMLTKATKYVDGSVVPAIEDMVDWFSRNSDEIESTASSIEHTLLPILKTAGGVLETTADLLGDIPAPLRNMGLQAGVAALALPKITSAVSSVSGAMSTGVAKVSQFRAEMTYTETRSAALQSTMTRLGSAARSAAGIGGMLALSAAASTSNRSLSVLGSTAGGALLGFSAGGPVGAAIGAGAGLLGGLAASADKSTDAFRTAREATEGYASTLEGLGAQIGEATRKMAFQELQQTGLIKTMREIGLSDRQAVDAMVGSGRQRERVVAYINDHIAAIEAEADALRKPAPGRAGAQAQGMYQRKRAEILARRENYQAILTEMGALDSAVREKRKEINATAEWGERLKGIPKRVITAIETKGAPTSIGAVEKLVRQYKMTPKQVRTLVDLLGFDPSRRKMRELMRAARGLSKTKAHVKATANTRPAQRSLERLKGAQGEVSRSTRRMNNSLASTGRARPNLGGYNRSLASQSGRAQGTAQRAGKFIQAYLEGGTRKTRSQLKGFTGQLAKQLSSSGEQGRRSSLRIKQNIETGPKTAKANLRPFSSGVLGQLSALQGSARAQGTAVGSGIGAGLNSGIGGWVSTIAATAAAAVARAIAAARAEAQTRSPSRKTMKIGSQMAEGLEVGLRRRHPHAHRAGQRFVRRLIKGVKDGTSGVKKVIDRITALVRKRVDLKNAAAERAREKQILDSLKKRFTQLRKNARAQDRVNKRLKNEKAHLKELQQARKAYAAAVKEGVVSFGSVISVGQDEGFGSVQQMLDRMAERVKQAQQWSTMLEKLKKAGLNKTSLDQLAQAGIEGGFGTAQTLLSGGSSVIQQVNQFTAQLQAAGAKAGETTAGVMYDSGIKAAQGLIKGLQAKAAQLDQWARQIGRKLATAVRKALGIRSPSRVFADIGKQTVAGLRIGLDETYVKQSAVKLSDALVGGFGQPALEAYVASQGGAGAGVGNTYKIEVNVSPGASPVDVGREIVKAIKAYQGSGGAVTL